MGYPFKPGHLTYHYHRSKTSALLATESRGFRGMKPLQYIGVPPEVDLRHEVARLIVWHVVQTRPAVPSAVSYEVRQQGNALCQKPSDNGPTVTRLAPEP